MFNSEIRELIKHLNGKYERVAEEVNRGMTHGSEEDWNAARLAAAEANDFERELISLILERSEA